MPLKGHLRLVDYCLVYVDQLLTSSSNFKKTSNLSNFLFKSILLILSQWENQLFIPRYTKKSPNNLQFNSQNIDIWDEQSRHFWLLEIWTRHLHQNHYPAKIRNQVNPRLNQHFLRWKVKPESAQGAHTTGAYHGFCSTKQLEVYLLPLNGTLVCYRIIAQH